MILLYVYRTTLMADPSSYEEEICGGVGANFIICTNKHGLNGVQKFGGSNLLPEGQEKALKIAKERAILVEKVIETCLNNEKGAEIKN